MYVVPSAKTALGALQMTLRPTHVQTRVSGSLGGLGDSNPVADVFNSISGGLNSLIGQVTGSTAAKDAQQTAASIALSQAQAQSAIAAARAQADIASSQAIGYGIAGVGALAVAGFLAYLALRK